MADKDKEKEQAGLSSYIFGLIAMGIARYKTGKW